MRLGLALVTLLALTAVVGAHPMDIAYLRIETRGTNATVAIELDVDAVALLLERRGEAIDAAGAAAQADRIAQSTYAALAIENPTGTCTWQPATATLTGRTVRIASTAACTTAPAGRVLHLPFLQGRVLPHAFQLLVQQRSSGTDGLALVDRVHPFVTLGAGAPESRLVTFIGSGIAHIGAAPSEWENDKGGLKLPDGIDHILFLLGLLLGGGTLLRLAGIATGFTVGHTITLALATLGVVHPPGWFIEPVIALSIAFVAFEAITRKLEKHRWKIALGFGLVHGFGFANALTQLELSRGQMIKALFGFNFGVEIGQLILVLVLAPVVIAVHRQRWGQAFVIRPAALLIGIAGLYWFVQRVAG